MLEMSYNSCEQVLFLICEFSIILHFSSYQSMTAAVYSTDRSAPLRLFTGHISDVTAVCWHENATLIATSGDDKTARLWDLRTGKGVRVFTGSPSPLSCVALSSSSTSGAVSLLAAGTDAGAVCLWDVGSGKQLSVLQGHSDSVHSVSFSSDGTALASGSADCSLRVFDVNALMSLQQSSFTSRSSAIAAAPSSSSRFPNGPSTMQYTTIGMPLVCQSKHTYHTKFSPVYYVNYTDKNLLFSGGPFSLNCAISRGLSDRRDGGEDIGSHDNVDKAGAISKTKLAGRQVLTATEQETASALGLYQSIISS